MARRDGIVAFADELLAVEAFPEYGRPGLQVIGADEVTKVACGVSSSRELFVRAGAAGAQLVLVHHGLFWRTEPLVVDRRLKGRLETLFAGNLTLVAYHLALDAHPELGNNALLAERLGARREGEFAAIGAGAWYDEPVTIAELATRLRDATGREPLVFSEGPERIRRVAIVTGGGGTRLIEAAHEGYDALVTGEPEEPALHTARELGIHFLAGGHYATETFGVKALAARLADEFGLEWEFLDLPNPV
ncbi:MAG TPA: Nif3-like dinuclear metal center hexameric protein [Gaiellaceae bacterium]